MYKGQQPYQQSVHEMPMNRNITSSQNPFDIPSPQLNRSIQTASVASIVWLIISIQGDKEAGLVVLTQHYRNVDVGVVTIVDATKHVVTMELTRVGVKFQVLVVKVQGSKGQYQGL